jgi:hypothetical protein
MKKSILTAAMAASALVAGLAASPVMAQNINTPGIDRSQQQITLRVQQGVQSGQISPAEADNFYRRERGIEMRESRARADGNVSPQERQQLRADVASLNAEVEQTIASRMPGRVVVLPRPVAVAPAPVVIGVPQVPQYSIGQRIEEARRLNRISPREAEMLHGREQAIANNEARFRSDGVLTEWESNELATEQAALSSELDRLAYNGRG